MEHTKEPWRVSDKSKRVVCYGHDEVVINSEANARRIVACVNACSHIPTDRLEMAMPGQMKSSLDGLCDSVERLTDQRDELLAALEAMLEEVAGCYCTTEAAARAVIQKVRGGE